MLLNKDGARASSPGLVRATTGRKDGLGAGADKYRAEQSRARRSRCVKMQTPDL